MLISILSFGFKKTQSIQTHVMSLDVQVGSRGTFLSTWRLPPFWHFPCSEPGRSRSFRTESSFPEHPIAQWSARYLGGQAASWGCGGTSCHPSFAWLWLQIRISIFRIFGKKLSHWAGASFSRRACLPASAFTSLPLGVEEPFIKSSLFPWKVWVLMNQHFLLKNFQPVLVAVRGLCALISACFRE